jgi:hypothetical protein
MDFKQWIYEEGLGKYNKSGILNLYHYSDAPPNQNGEIYLHPEKAVENRHSYSRSEFQVASFPRLFFYLRQKDIEKDPMVKGNNLYKSTIEANKIYPMEEDPEKFKEKAMVDGFLSHHYMMYLLKEAGFLGGYYNAGSGDVVILWIPIKAKLVKHI